MELKNYSIVNECFGETDDWNEPCVRKREYERYVYNCLEFNKERVLEAYNLRWRYNPTMLMNEYFKWTRKWLNWRNGMKYFEKDYKTYFRETFHDFMVMFRKEYQRNPDKICSNANIQVADYRKNLGHI